MIISLEEQLRKDIVEMATEIFKLETALSQARLLVGELLHAYGPFPDTEQMSDLYGRAHEFFDGETK